MQMMLTALPGIPVVRSGDDLADLILSGLRRADIELQADDILAVTQKVVSKAEGRTVDLRKVNPSEEALELAKVAKKDPRLVELILTEAVEVLRVRLGLIIVVHRLGFVCANAGVDHSNVEGEDRVLLLPEDPRPRRVPCGSLFRRRVGPTWVCSYWTLTAGPGAWERKGWRSALAEFQHFWTCEASPTFTAHR